MSKLNEGLIPALVDMLDVLLLCSPVFMWWLDWCLGLMFSTESHCLGVTNARSRAPEQLSRHYTKTGSGCSKYVKCFSHAPIVWCSAFWNVKLLFCNDFALLAIATTHQSYSLKFSHSTASRGQTAWHARDISCVISIFQHYKHLQKFLIILAASSNDHDSKCGNTILSMSIIYISTFRVCQARWLSCEELHLIDVCW